MCRMTPGAFDLRRLVADGGDDGVDRQMASDHSAGIDALELNPLVRLRHA